MSLKFKCPSCGQTGSLPLELAGRLVKCRHCGQKMKLPGGPIDVAGAQGAAPTGPSAAWASPDSSATRYMCAVCNGQFLINDVYDQQGRVICKTCFEAEQANAYAGALPSEAALSGHATDSICAGCGVAVSGEQSQEINGQVMCANCAMLAAAQASSAPAGSLKTMRSSGRTQQLGYGVWVLGGSVAAAVVLIAVAIIVRSTSHTTRIAAVAPTPTPASPGTSANVVKTDEAVAPDWETSNAPRLAEYSRRAAEQDSAGDFTAASDSYQQYLALARGAPHPSDALRAKISAAELAWAALKTKQAAADPHPVVATDHSIAPNNSDTDTTTKPAAPPEPNLAQSWEQQHRKQIERLLKQSETQLGANNSFNAALAYQQLFELVGGHASEIQDPALQQRISKAAAARGRLLVQVKSSPEAVAFTGKVLLSTGLEALTEEHWQAGMESLSDVRQLFDRNLKMSDRIKDPNYLLALQGLAVAYLNTKQAPKAGQLFDEASPLGAAVDREPSRELIVNRAVTDIIQKTKAMRAAKSIKSYLEKHPDDADEKMLNLLGTALFIANQHTTSKAMLNQIADFYAKANADLEKTRPGEKRWGIEWLPAREVDEKFAAQKQAREEWQRHSAEATVAYNDWQNKLSLYTPHPPAWTRYVSLDVVQRAEGFYQKASQAAEEARSRVIMPPWLTEVNPVLPPMPKGVMLASAATSGTPGTASMAGLPDTTPPVTDNRITLPGSTDSTGSAPSDTDTASEPPASSTSSPPVHFQVPRHALAFAVDKQRLITDADVMGDVTDVRIENAAGEIISAHLVAKKDRLALLEVNAAELQGRSLAYLNLAPGFTGGAVRCAGVPLANIFGPLPVMLTGQAAAPSQTAWTVDLSENPRLPGSPLIDAQGNLVGVVMASREDLRTRLPATSLAEIHEFLSARSALPAARCPNPDPLGVFEVTVQQK